MELLVFGHAGAKVLIFPMDIVLVIGKEDPFLDNNRHLSGLLWGKGVWHALHEWDERAHRGRYWRQMAPLYI